MGIIKISDFFLTDDLLVASKNHVSKALHKQNRRNQANRSNAAKRELVAVSLQIGVNRILLELVLLEKRHVFLDMVRLIAHPDT